MSLSKFLEYDKYYPKEFAEFCSSYPEDKLSISSSIYWYTNPSFVFRIEDKCDKEKYSIKSYQPRKGKNKGNYQRRILKNLQKIRTL